MEIAKKEPAAYHYYCDGTAQPVLTNTKKDWTEKDWWREVPLYEKAEWVGLTDEEYRELHIQMGEDYFYQDYGRAIEAKLKEKNATN